MISPIFYQRSKRAWEIGRVRASMIMKIGLRGRIVRNNRRCWAVGDGQLRIASYWKGSKIGNLNLAGTNVFHRFIKAWGFSECQFLSDFCSMQHIMSKLYIFRLRWFFNFKKETKARLVEVVSPCPFQYLHDIIPIEGHIMVVGCQARVEVLIVLGSGLQLMSNQNSKDKMLIGKHYWGAIKVL